MGSSPKVKGNTDPVLPRIQEATSTPDSWGQSRDERKESSTAPSILPPKPLLTRTPSTRIAEPVQKAWQSDHASGPATSAPQRPNLPHRRTTARTRYIDMLLGLDDVSPLHNILASACVWILLAGYIVFPATFTKLRNSSSSSSSSSSASDLETAALQTVRNVPLLYVAAFLCGLGVLGCLYLWWKHRSNYVWLINRIFLPALLNSAAGLISTLVNVYSAQEGVYSVTARATVVVTSSCGVVTAVLFLLYNTVMLSWVRMRHEREVRSFEKEEERRGGGGGGEGV